MTTITSGKLKFQYENFKEIITQVPRIRKAIFIKTTRIPPKYFPSSNCVLESGLERSKSIFPFSSISGTKLDAANMASNRHKFDNGAVIINCIFEIISASAKLSPAGLRLDKIESVFIKLNTTVSPSRKRAEMIVKKINTFRANASRKVYHDMIKIFFTALYSFLLRLSEK